METRTYHFVNSEGWRLALRRWRPVPGATRAHPVMLLHGLGSNRTIFDLDENHSLARFLCSQGFDTWAVELRGHGDSEAPSLGSGKRYNWCFDDYLACDVPETLEFICRKSGADSVHWVGHSMGGILLLAHTSVKKGERVRSGITVGSSLDYSRSKSWFHTLLPLRRFSSWLPPIPLGQAMAVLATAGGRIPNPLEGFYYWQPNTEPEVQRAILSKAFHVIPVTLLSQLASAFEEGGLCSIDGSARYLSGLGSTQTPLMMLIGEKDVQCPPEAGAATFERIGGETRELRIYGRSHGQPEDYGHFDLLLGKRARQEVFPDILEWLTRLDS